MPAGAVSQARPDCQVFVAGPFNHWSPTSNPMHDDHGSAAFNAVVHLHRGLQEYKFVVDGEWVEDPRCAETVANDFGTRNNVMYV